MKYFLFSFAFSLMACGSKTGEDTKVHSQSAGTLKMVKRLEEINAMVIANTADSKFTNSIKAEDLKKKIEAANDPAVKFALTYNYNIELLNAGKTKEAIAGFEHLLSMVKGDNGNINDENKPIYDQLGIAYLRQGEQENCLVNHTGNSCILPLQKDAWHTKKAGSQHAIEIYTTILEKYPEDKGAQWLLNVAYMTLGEFPKYVPEKWKIPEAEFISDNTFPRFNNIAGNLNVDIDNHAGGCCAEDFNNDGYLDLMLSGMGITDQLQFFINKGDGTFEERTEQPGLTGLVGGLNINHTDYNNDGFMDVLVLRGGWMGKTGHYPNSLLKNNGDGSFDDVTYEAGIYAEHPTQNAAWADVDLDGFVDLFIGNESANGDSSDCEFYFNNGNGTFTNVASSVGLNFKAFVKASVLGDVNNDGLPDLYVSTIGSDNRLYLNKGGADHKHWKFENVATTAKVQKPYLSFPTCFFDYDNDGFEDLFACSYDVRRYAVGSDEVTQMFHKKPATETLRMYHNNGDGTFEDVTQKTGMDRVIYGMSCNFGDLNNDGFLDFYIGTGNPDFQSIVPNKMFLNQQGNTFKDVTTSGGFGHIQKGHAISFTDLDNDGDQDVYAQMGGAYEGDNFRNALFENPGFDNNWVVLQLKGKSANRAAIGAMVKLTITENGKQRYLYRRISTGGSFGSSSLQLFVGLGKASKVDEVKITWPNKKQTVQKFQNLQANKKYILEENNAKATPAEYKALMFKPGGGGHKHVN